MNSFKIKSFKYGLDEWVIILLISGFSTIIYYNQLQSLSNYSHNYLLSKKFTKRLPFYLSIVFDIICGVSTTLDILFKSIINTFFHIKFINSIYIIIFIFKYSLVNFLL